MSHTKLTCGAARNAERGKVIRCDGVLARLWGAWRKLYPVSRGTETPEGLSQLHCKHCGTAWLVEQVQQEDKAA